MAAGLGAPNPGSDAARTLGCTCPVVDNNRGLSAPWPPDNWYINRSCPMHNGAIPDDEIRPQIGDESGA